MRTDFFVIFTRPFWLDEWHTILVARRDSLAQVISDLHRGSDFGPPLSHFVAWILGNTVGLTPVALRLVALTCVLLGMALLFLTLRRRFDVLPSVAGTLTVASHALVIGQALEWRFYAPWVLFAAALAWSLGIDADKPASRRRDVAMALASIGLVTSHWFGVLTLGLMGAAALATYGLARWRAGLRRVIPMAAGVVALAIVLPLMIGQRGSIVEKSWMPDVTPAQVLAMLRLFWAAWIPILAIVLVLVSVLRARSTEKLRADAGPVIRDPAIAALLVTALMPLLLAIISIRQPAMLPRYAITVLFAWAPLMAFALQPFGRVMRGIAVASLVILTYARVLNTAVSQRSFTIAIAAAKQGLEHGCPRGVPVLFQVRHLMYPATEAGNVAGCDVRYLSISSATLASMYPGTESQQRFFRLENEFSELHGRLYGFPVVAHEAQLDTTRAFLLVGWDESLPGGYKNIERFRAAVFPQHRVTRLTENLALFERP